MDGQIFIRLRHRIKTGIDQLIYLEDIAQITGDEFAVQKLSKILGVSCQQKGSSHRRS